MASEDNGRLDEGGPDYYMVQNWKPKHDQIALMHAAGRSNIEISQVVGMTEVRVCQILKDPRARQAVEEFRERVKTQVLSNVGDKIVLISEEAIENLRRTIQDSPEANSGAKRHQDKVSIKVLELAGFGPKGVGVNAGEGALEFPRDVAEKMLEAIEKSDRAREVHDAEFSVESEEVSEGDGVGES